MIDAPGYLKLYRPARGNDRLTQYIKSEAVQGMDWVKEKMYQARLQRKKLQVREAMDNPGNSSAVVPEVTTSRLSESATAPPGLVWLMAGTALGVILAILMWWTVSAERDDNPDRYISGGGVTGQQRDPAEPPPEHTNAGELKEELLRLTAQMQTLAGSVADLRAELASIHAPTDPLARASRQQGTPAETTARLETLPPPAAGQGVVSAVERRDAGKADNTTSRNNHQARNEMIPAVSGIQTRQGSPDSGPWVINLVSLPDKADAERFISKAGPRGVAADLSHVTVKGKDFWRVQVAGFSTAAEAQGRASVIKERLGLKEVWIMKR